MFEVLKRTLLAALVVAAPRGLERQDCTGPEGRFHAPQWEFANSDEREAMALVGRQGGKTGGARLRAARVATSGPKKRVLYCTYDLDLGREEFFDPLCELLTDWDWEYKSDQTKLKIVLSNGSVIRCKSADDNRSAGRLRGRNWDLMIFDEVQELDPEVLRKLVVDVAGPMQFRRRGSLVLMFTPPDSQSGWLWEEFKSGRWKLFTWKQSDNPWLPVDEQERWLTKRGIDINHPTAKRELLGLWEPNTEKRVFSGFDWDLNTYAPGTHPDHPERDYLPDELVDIAKRFPELPRDQWRFGTGSDIGWEHPDSIVIVAWNHHDPRQRIWEVYAWKENHKDIDAFFEKFHGLWLQCKPMLSNVMDQAGAGGQKVVHTVGNRFRKMGLPLRLTYKPASVPASVGIVNDNFRTMKLILRTDSLLVQEIPQAMWLDGSNRQEIDKAKFDPHGLDGLRYAVWGATNFRGTEPPAPPPSDPEDVRKANITAAIDAMKRRMSKRPNRPIPSPRGRR